MGDVRVVMIVFPALSVLPATLDAPRGLHTPSTDERAWNGRISIPQMHGWRFDPQGVGVVAVTTCPVNQAWRTRRPHSAEW